MLKDRAFTSWFNIIFLFVSIGSASNLFQNTALGIVGIFRVLSLWRIDLWRPNYIYHIDIPSTRKTVFRTYLMIPRSRHERGFRNA
jgi:hypothetical protein